MKFVVWHGGGLLQDGCFFVPVIILQLFQTRRHHRHHPEINLLEARVPGENWDNDVREHLRKIFPSVTSSSRKVGAVLKFINKELNN
jgi:hypothetical protein